MELTDSEVEKYASIASIHEDIISFPEGYDTLVGERGVTLSGGQKQRVAIARALIKQTPIIVLDDCLSAVDTETEKKILDSLKDSQGKHSIVVVSHRLKAVVDADMIYVMHEGRIVERGKHHDLIGNGGLYQRMYERQMIEEKLKED